MGLRRTIEKRLRDLLTTKEVAEQLGRTPQYICRLAKKYGLGRRLGGRRIYSQKSIRLLRKLLRPVGHPRKDAKRSPCAPKSAPTERNG